MRPNETSYLGWYRPFLKSKTFRSYGRGTLSKRQPTITFFLIFTLLSLTDIAFGLTRPSLRSNPGASHVIYLDIDGHNEGVLMCNEVIKLNDAQKMKGVFYTRTDLQPQEYPDLKPEERQWLVELWMQVAEDFAPFDVDVAMTAWEPAELANDTGRALRIVVGRPEGKWNHEKSGFAIGSCDVGLVPWNDPITNVGWVNVNLASIAAEAGKVASHEAGHLMGFDHTHIGGLARQRKGIMEGGGLIMSSSGRVEQYLWQTGWNEFGRYQDELAELGKLLGARTFPNGISFYDDHGDDEASSTELVHASHVPAWPGRLFAYGVITEGDVDVFRFNVDDVGLISINVVPGLGGDIRQARGGTVVGPNLDVKVSLWKEGFYYSPVVVYDPPSLFLSTLLPSARFYIGQGPVLFVGETYYLQVESNGDYGELGNYTIVVDGPVSGKIDPTLRPPYECIEGCDDDVHFDGDRPIPDTPHF